MPFSQAIDHSVLQHLVKQASWTQPAAFYVGLSSTTPTKTGTNVTEPSGFGYARVAIGSAEFTSPAASSIETNIDKSFPIATGDWADGADLTDLVCYDAITAGNFIGFKALTVAKPVLNGDTAKILAGDFSIAMGGT